MLCRRRHDHRNTVTASAATAALRRSLLQVVALDCDPNTGVSRRAQLEIFRSQ
jgi:hypothetical protein